MPPPSQSLADIGIGGAPLQPQAAESSCTGYWAEPGTVMTVCRFLFPVPAPGQWRSWGRGGRGEERRGSSQEQELEGGDSRPLLLSPAEPGSPCS